MPEPEPPSESPHRHPVRPNRLVRWSRVLHAGWIAYWIALTFLLHTPKPPKPPISFSQKGLVVHFTTFALLTAGCALVHRSRDRLWGRGWALVWSLVFITYGAASELAQPLTGRHPDPADFAANASGVLVAMAIVMGLGRRWRT